MGAMGAMGVVGSGGRDRRTTMGFRGMGLGAATPSAPGMMLMSMGSSQGMDSSINGSHGMSGFGGASGGGASSGAALGVSVGVGSTPDEEADPDAAYTAAVLLRDAMEILRDVNALLAENGAPALLFLGLTDATPHATFASRLALLLLPAEYPPSPEGEWEFYLPHDTRILGNAFAAPGTGRMRAVGRMSARVFANRDARRLGGFGRSSEDETGCCTSCVRCCPCRRTCLALCARRPSKKSSGGVGGSGSSGSGGSGGRSGSAHAASSGGYTSRDDRSRFQLCCLLAWTFLPTFMRPFHNTRRPATPTLVGLVFSVLLTIDVLAGLLMGAITYEFFPWLFYTSAVVPPLATIITPLVGIAALAFASPTLHRAFASFNLVTVPMAGVSLAVLVYHSDADQDPLGSIVGIALPVLWFVEKLLLFYPNNLYLAELLAKTDVQHEWDIFGDDWGAQALEDTGRGNRDRTESDGGDEE